MSGICAVVHSESSTSLTGCKEIIVVFVHGLILLAVSDMLCVDACIVSTDIETSNIPINK